MVPMGTIIGSSMLGAAFMDVITMGVGCVIGTKLGHSKPEKPIKPYNPKMFNVVKKKGR